MVAGRTPEEDPVVVGVVGEGESFFQAELFQSQPELCSTHGEVLVVLLVELGGALGELVVTAVVKQPTAEQ